MDEIYNVNIEGSALTLKRLNKPFDSFGTSKAHIIDYYQSMASLILPHIKNKPFSMIHFPNGALGKSFFAKRKPPDAPAWLKSVFLDSSGGGIDFCLVNNTASIIYMVNRGVVEMHSFFSRLPNLSMPDIAVIDLDPSNGAGFKEAIEVARIFKILLDQLNLFAVPKTSGSSGIHIYIPIKNADFAAVQAFLSSLCRIVESQCPHLATTQRSKAKRGDKVYLDAVQNAYGKTIPSPYSLRCKQHLPFSAPLLWHELNNPNLSPLDFTLATISQRLSSIGDPFNNFYLKRQPLPTL